MSYVLVIASICVFLTTGCAHRGKFDTGSEDHVKVCADRQAFSEYARHNLEGELSGWQTRGLSADESVAHSYLDVCLMPLAVALTQKFVGYPTVSELQSPATGYAFVELREYLAELAKSWDMQFLNVGANDAWELSAGKGPLALGLLMHADVVPAGDVGEPERKVPLSSTPEDWERPPFVASVHNGRIYGRGSQDDKGPIAAALVVLRALSMFDHAKASKFLLMIGNGEESDWEPMKRYAANSKPKPRHIVSVDADFPAVIAESGFVEWVLRIPLDDADAKNGLVLKNLVGGEFLTQVPSLASADIVGREAELIKLQKVLAVQAAQLKQAAAEQNLAMSIEMGRDSERLRLVAHGVSVHTSEADHGGNAFWALSDLLRGIALTPNGASTMLQLLHEKFSGDHWGQKLGIAYADALMGPLLVAPTVLNVSDGKVQLRVNMRRPVGRTNAEFAQSLADAAARLGKEYPGVTGESAYIGDPVQQSSDSDLVRAALAVYARHTGEKNPQPISIRGGTYARLFPGAISFGPGFPGKIYRGHSANEYIEVDELRLLVHMLYDLAVTLNSTPSL